MASFVFIADQASKMYKNVLGADVSDVMVSTVQINLWNVPVFIQHPYCSKIKYFIVFFVAQNLPEHGVSTVFVNLGNSKLEVQ